MNPIVIPRNSLVLLCGTAGSGKSTFAKKHFITTEIVSSDECRALISDDPTNQRVSGHAFDLMRFLIEKRLLLGRLTVADATNLERGARNPLKRLGRRLGFNLVAIVFDIPLETCLVRNKARQRMVPQEAIIRQYSMLEDTLRVIHREGLDYVFVIDEQQQSRINVRISRRLFRMSGDLDQTKPVESAATGPR